MPNQPISRVPMALAALAALLAHSPVSAQVPETWSYLRNDSVTIGVRRDRGASVGFFARTSNGRNLLNHYDHGRFLQQSFYGDKDGSDWNGKPWRWNPVQGGCWTGKRAGVMLEFRNDGRSLYARSQPINWGGCDAIDAVMEEWIELRGNVAMIRFKFTNHGRDNTGAMSQEMPAVFVDAALRNLVRYDGSSPWKDGALKRDVPGWPNSSGQLTENWAAYVDDKDWGIGVYTPGTTRMTYYRFDGDGTTGPTGSACSYFAPLRTLTVRAGFSIEYRVYLAIGSSSQIRQEFRVIHETGVPQGDSGSSTIRKPAVPAFEPVPGLRTLDLLGRRLGRWEAPSFHLRTAPLR